MSKFSPSDFSVGGGKVFQAKRAYVEPPDPVKFNDVEYKIFHKSDDNTSTGYLSLTSSSGGVEEIELFSKTFNDDYERDIQWTIEKKLELSEDKSFLFIEFTSTAYEYFYHFETKSIVAFSAMKRSYGVEVEQYKKKYRVDARLRCAFENDEVALSINYSIEKFGKTKELEGETLLLKKKLSELKKDEVNVLVSDVNSKWDEKELQFVTVDGTFVLDENRNLSKQ